MKADRHFGTSPSLLRARDALRRAEVASRRTSDGWPEIAAKARQEGATSVTVRRGGQVSWTGTQGYNAAHIKFSGTPTAQEYEDAVAGLRSTGLTVKADRA